MYVGAYHIRPFFISQKQFSREKNCIFALIIYINSSQMKKFFYS